MSVICMPAVQKIVFGIDNVLGHQLFGENGVFTAYCLKDSSMLGNTFFGSAFNVY